MTLRLEWLARDHFWACIFCRAAVQDWCKNCGFYFSLLLSRYVTMAKWSGMLPVTVGCFRMPVWLHFCTEYCTNYGKGFYVYFSHSSWFSGKNLMSPVCNRPQMKLSKTTEGCFEHHLIKQISNHVRERLLVTWHKELPSLQATAFLETRDFFLSEKKKIQETFFLWLKLWIWVQAWNQTWQTLLFSTHEMAFLF